MYSKDILTEEYLTSLDFEKVLDDGQYGNYHNKLGMVSKYYGLMPGKKRIVIFNRDKDFLYVKILEDGGTRTVFNGVIQSREIFETILSAIN